MTNRADKPPSWLTEVPPPDFDAYEAERASGNMWLDDGETILPTRSAKAPKLAVADRTLADEVPPSSIIDNGAALPRQPRSESFPSRADSQPRLDSASLLSEASRHASRRMPCAATEAPVLDPRNPMPTACALVADGFTADGLPTLHHYRGAFWRWNGSCYCDADKDDIQAQIWKYLDRAMKYNKDSLKVDFQPNRGDTANVAEALKAVCNLSSDVEAPTWLKGGYGSPPSELLPVRNGLLHLPSGRLEEPSPAFFCMNASDVLFDEYAPEPKEWLCFLKQVWQDDPQSIETLQDSFGYLMSSDTSHQKILLIVGPKRSGKGTIAHVLAALLGRTGVAGPTLATLATNFGLAPLIGKSVAIVADARLSGKADQATIAERLLSISGEDRMTIDRKFQSAWNGKLGVRFVIMSNELPRLSDASGALASRFILLIMKQSFYGREDLGLKNRLLAELPGILNWARVGYLRLRKCGYFITPDSAREVIEELEELASPISAFVKARCFLETGRRESINDIYKAWCGWCDANGRREHGTAQSFGRDLRAAVPGLRVTQPRKDGIQVRYYEGIAVKNENW